MRVRLLALIVGAGVAGAAQAETYALDFIATASSGHVMNRAGTVVAGTTTLAPTCAGCSPTYSVPSIWVNGKRSTVAIPAGASYLQFAGAAVDGWVAGTAMRFDSTGGAGYVWVPRADGSGVDATAIGTLNGLQDAMPAGIDDQHRVFGLARTWMQAQDSFVWNPAGGISSLSAAGYPSDPPVAVSPAATIATATLTYRYGNLNSVTVVAQPPSGYYGTSSTQTGAINDAGMRASMLLATTSQNYRYLARYTDASGWQVLSGAVSGSVPYGVGGVNPDGSLTATLTSTGYRAAGPSGGIQTLSSQISPAYGTVSVGNGGDLADNGAILAQASIGQSLRMVKLTPVSACSGSSCMTVSALTMTGRMKGTSCTATATNSVTAKVTVTDPATGLVVSGATVRGRFLDDYYLDKPVALATNSSGVASFSTTTAACTGAIAFLVDGVDKSGRTLDRTRGKLAAYVIPQPR